MPAQYDAIKRRMLSEGKSLKEAKTSAAKIYNSKHHKDPVYPGSDKPDKVKRRKP